MSEEFDPYWQAAARHVVELEIPARSAFATADFDPLLPGCRTPDDAPSIDDLQALVLHKGRLEEVDCDILLPALDTMTVTFANEVFLVLTRKGKPFPDNSPHLMRREDMLVAALRGSQNRAANTSHARSGRMAATYVGKDKVLLETAYGQLMQVDGADTGIVPHLIRDGFFDLTLTNVILGLLRPGMTFIDIGANFGTYTLLGAEKVGKRGRVIAMEPAPTIAAMLNENVVMNGLFRHCTVLRCAAGATEGTQVLHQFATRQGSNTMLAHVAEVAQENYGETITSHEVVCRTLDSVATEMGLERIDLLKIDVEGFEYEVLNGARGALAKFRPTIILEWGTSFFVDRIDAAHQLYDLITGGLGYDLRRIEDDGTTRAITFDELMALGHSDLLAEPAK